MAVEELREAKRANSDLQAKLARKGGDISGGAPGALNWEAQKERLLASLEADDRDDEEAAEERQTIEGTIRITDQMVAQKDREIAELKRQVGDGSAHQQAAAADLLDHDETIRAEREKLQKAQEEWRQRIGQAEIDISVERAKLARERLELEEKSRVLQAEQAKCAPQGPSSGEPAKPQRGRWLARLGLKDLDDKS
jgi:chromosome segregation ATPase